MIRSGVGKTPRVRAADPQGVYRAVLTSLLSDGNTVADYRADTGVTGTLAVSSWANQLGTAPALAQATGGNQPIYLPFSGEKYLYVPGVTGNNATTPDSAANSITGSIDIRVRVAMNDWTPAAFSALVAKWNSVGPAYDYLFGVNTGGGVLFGYSADGSTARTANSSVGAGIADGSVKWIRATYNSSTGKVDFYTSDDGSTWSALGTQQSLTAGSINNSGNSLYIGQDQYAPGGNEPSNGKIYRAQIYNGIDGTLAVDFNPALSNETTTNGATWTASTGETWTLNNTGAKPAQVVGSSQLLGDGTNHWLDSGVVSYTQPLTSYLVVKPITWTLNDALVQYSNGSNCVLFQAASSPNLSINCGGSTVAENTGATIGAYHVIQFGANGASSFIQVDGNAATTGNAGTTGANRILLAAGSVAGGFAGNLQIKEFIIRSAADSAATRALIYQYLRAIHGTP